MNFGLVCKLYKEPINFRTYTYAHISKLWNNGEKDLARSKVLDVWNANIESIQKAINYCSENNISSYRVSSDTFPQYTRMIELGVVTKEDLEKHAKKLAKVDTKEVKLSMHPGQHVNMGSPREQVVENSLQDLKEHFFVAEQLGITEINIHAGGVYGDKPAAMNRFIERMNSLLTKEELNMMTIENDELSYSIEDVLYLCNELGIRATFDIHHHRAHQLKNELPLTEEEYFLKARETWDNYEYQRIHMSSPKIGKYTTATKSRPHADFVDQADIPQWLDKYDNVEIDIEAKAKEEAIFKLQEIE